MKWAIIGATLIFAASASAAIRNVSVANFSFKDAVSLTATTTINQGDTVHWFWTSGTHTTTSDTDLWNQPIDSINPTFDYTFDTPGTYGYKCVFHSMMRGTIIVLPASIPPATLTVSPGVILSGDVSSLSASDDVRVVGAPGPVLVSSTPPLQAVMTATAPAATFSSFRFKLESSATANNLEQKIAFYDYIAGGFVEMDTSTPSGTDSIRDILVTTNFARFINASNREIKVRVTYKTTGPVLVYPWNARIDMAQWILPA